METARDRFRRYMQPDPVDCAQCEQPTTKPQPTPFGLICPVCVARNEELNSIEARFGPPPVEQTWDQNHKPVPRRYAKKKSTSHV